MASSLSSLVSTVPTPSSTSSSGATTAANLSLSPSQMFQFIVAQMTNQSPLDPTSSDDMMQEVVTMQSAAETAQLTSDFETYQKSQGLTDAAVMIGATVTVKDSIAGTVSGVVSAASISNGAVSVTVNGTAYPLTEIQNVQ